MVVEMPSIRENLFVSNGFQSQYLSDDMLKETFIRCSIDSRMACRTFFPERFFRPFSALHQEIFDILDDDNIQKAVIAAPRGFGKTTIDTIAYPAKRILYREKKFVVPISATATSAVMQGENLKNELLSNPIIKEFFGPMTSKKFSSEQWITSTGTMVMPRGARQQVRGILHGRYRPDLIIADDLEDPDHVKSDEQRERLKEWWFSDVCNSVDRGSTDWKIVLVGTVLHEDSLLCNLLDDSDWHSVNLSICDDSFKSNWPDFISDEQVKALYNAHKEKGLTDLFFREYRNIPISKEDAIFQEEFFKYYEEGDLSKEDLYNMFTVVIVDPAKTVKLQSAESAVVGVTIDREGKRIYVRDIVSEKMYPDELYDQALDMVVRLRARMLAVEVTSLHLYITEPLKNEMRVRGIHPIFRELDAKGDKDGRIADLGPLYRMGYIHHKKGVCDALESQLLMHPKSKLKDISDALAYINKIIVDEDHWFDPPALENHEDEYAELQNDTAVVPRGLGSPFLPRNLPKRVPRAHRL
jgi:hypothetical protein